MNMTLTPQEMTRRSVRAFWADGLWDFAMAGVLAILGLWVYPFTLLSFPRHAWAWPLSKIPGSVSPPLLSLAWLVVLVLSLLVFLWVSWKAVLWLKEKLVAPFTGRVKHTFWLPIESKVMIWYGIVYIFGGAALAVLFAAFKGGPHILGVFYAMSPAAIFFLIGKVYDLPRYRWLAVIGLTTSLLLEAFATTHAFRSFGPRNILDVNPEHGQPVIACSVFFVLLVISGIIGLAQVRRVRHDA